MLKMNSGSFRGQCLSTRSMLARHLILSIQPARDSPLRTSPWLRLWGAAIGWEDPMSCPMVGWAPINLFKVLFVFTLMFSLISDGWRWFSTPSVALILFYAILFVLNAENIFMQRFFPCLLSFIIFKSMAKTQFQSEY